MRGGCPFGTRTSGAAIANRASAPGVTNPFNWILFAMPLRGGHLPVPTLHWYWVLIHWVAAAFGYWLCRDVGARMARRFWADRFSRSPALWPRAHAAIPVQRGVEPVVFLFAARVWRGRNPRASARMRCGPRPRVPERPPQYPDLSGGDRRRILLCEIAIHRRIVPAAVFVTIVARGQRSTGFACHRIRAAGGAPGRGRRATALKDRNSLQCARGVFHRSPQHSRVGDPRPDETRRAVRGNRGVVPWRSQRPSDDGAPRRSNC